ncbi:MAG: GtrA family protein [Tannerellaceae bacterium]|jgi:putative flippase GtrA|nr:GtrA family protein [Tannerellaceae bacterium]
MKTIVQAIKYGIVGISNTLITAIVIWVMMKPLGCPVVLSNITGYIAGVLNSFILNKQWTFKSRDSWVSSAIRFGIVFGVCYLLQLGLLLYLNKRLAIDPYYNQLMAMVFYMAANFLMNKFYTFKERKDEENSCDRSLL